MKRIRSITLIVVISIFLHLCAPFASATQNFCMDDVFFFEEFACYGYEDDQMLYNLILNTNSKEGSFAIKYFTETSIVYEYSFDVAESCDILSPDFWSNAIEMCFDHSDQWQSIVLEDAVIINETASSSISPYATDPYVTYFRNYLVNLYGQESYGNELQSTTKNGISMKQYEQKIYRVNKNRTYVITAAITVAGFITGVLGLAVSSTTLTVIGALLGAGSLFTIGQSVYQYQLIANWCRYITINGGSYPYNMADKYITFTGYSYTETGNYAVDTASKSTSYIPSYEYYLRYNLQFEDAYEKYLEIGWQG